MPMVTEMPSSDVETMSEDLTPLSMATITKSKVTPILLMVSRIKSKVSATLL